MRPGESREIVPNGCLINGRYEVIGTLGYGGMGTVVKVKDTTLDDEVGALKILFPHLASDEIQFARFRNEVLLARRLSHPHIVRIYDFGSWAQYYFLSMEYVEGGTLNDRIYPKGHDKLQFDDTIGYLLQILDALSYAHNSGVVHRDMKPDNIMINQCNMAKVTDFGLARATDIDKRFTSTGETVGTPYYMSPEQLAGEKPDARVDIYSLGIIAYEMFICRRPFASDNYMELAHMHMTQALPNMCQINSSTPVWYKEFVEICCEKRAENRFSSCEEASRFILDNVDGKIKQKIHKVPAVLSMGALPRVNKNGSYGRLKTAAVGVFSLWMVFFLVFMLPLGPLTYGKLRSKIGALENFYPFISFDEIENFPRYLEEMDWYRIKELIAMDPSLIKDSSQSIVKLFSSEELPQLKDILEFVDNQEFLLDLILDSKSYDVVGYSVEKLAKLGALPVSEEKEDLLVVKLMSFNEPSLVIEYFSITNGGLFWSNQKGESLLVFAYRAKAWNCFRVLLERGISPDAKLANGVALVSLAKKENPEISQLLVQYGADTGVTEGGVKVTPSQSLK